MKEDRIEQLMQSYGESLGASTKRTVTKPTPRRSKVLIPVAAGALVAMTAFAMWPRDAVAAAVRRMGLAIQNARTMERTSAMKVGSGKWRVFGHSYYQAGMWRHINRQGTGLEVVIVVRDGQAMTDYRHLNHATLEKLDPQYFDLVKGESVSALDLAKESTDMGQVGIKRTMTVEPHAPVNRRATYSVKFVRPEDSYQAEIVVDKQTDLPLYSTSEVTYSRGDHAFYREDYLFNQRLPSSLFQFNSPKPIVNLYQAQEQLTKEWARPLAALKGIEFRDAQITKDGTIWIATTMAKGAEPRAFPSTIAGGDYVRLLDIVPSAILGKTERYSFHGQDVVIFGFAPLNPDQPKPKSVTLEFDQRSLQLPGFSKNTAQTAPTDDTQTLELMESKEEDRPAYFTALDLDHFGFQLPVIVWNTRATALRERGRLLEAAKAYEQSAVAYRQFIKYVGYQPLKKAAECYRELGMSRDAERATAEAKELEGSRER